MPMQNGGTPVPPPTTNTPNPARHIVLMGILGIVIVGAIAGGVIGLVKGWYSIPGFGPKAPTPEEIAKIMNDIKSGHTVTTSKISMEKRETSVTPIALANVLPGGKAQEEEITDALSIATRLLPQDASITTTVTSDFTGKPAATESKIVGKYEGNGMSLSFDADAKDLEKNVYVRLNTLPLGIMDLSGILGKWIDISKDLENGIAAFDQDKRDTQVFEYLNAAEATKPNTPALQDLALSEERTALTDEAIANGALTVSVLDEKTKMNGKQGWRMKLSVDPAKMQAAYLAVYKKKNAVIPEGKIPSLLSDDVQNVIKQPAFVTIGNTLLKNSYAEIFIEKKTRKPVLLTVDMKLAIDAVNTQLADRQLHVNQTTEFSKLNTTITIEAPKESLSPQQAMYAFLGITETQAKNEAQRGVIRDIREALKEYKSQKGTYPKALTDLLGQSDAWTRVVNIPIDRFTEQSFPYRQTENGYELEYTVQPSLEEKNGAIQNIEVVDGVNTATELYASKQAEMQMDADGDGMDDTLEKSMGTSPYTKDTDGDGYDDKTEIDTGHDPLVHAVTGVHVPAWNENLHQGPISAQ